GERILEVGPGTGRHALGIARRLEPGGVVDVLDVQQPMLDAVLERARRRGIDNLRATLGDARDLSWGDATFDGAYLVTVLGEIPDRHLALGELHRVLKPGGRLVVGELLMDPDNVTLKRLRAEAQDAGFRFEEVCGPRVFYLARFTRP